MSDEPRKDGQEDEVEAHKHRPAYDQPTQEGEDEGEVEAHKHRPKHRPKYRP